MRTISKKSLKKSYQKMKMIVQKKRKRRKCFLKDKTRFINPQYKQVEGITSKLD